MIGIKFNNNKFIANEKDYVHACHADNDAGSERAI